MSDELTAFILARIAEDEAAARVCAPWPWRVATQADERPWTEVWAGESVIASDGDWVAEPHALSGPQTRANRDHIARHDPARVLRECEAKRRIVALWESGVDVDADRLLEYETTAYAFEVAYDALESVVRALASVWSDHPDYRREWS